MNWSAHTVPAEPLAVKRVGSTVWILRLNESLDDSTASALSDAFNDAIERDAADVVVDLGAVATVSAEGAATLGAMADLMRSRLGSLWIAAAWPDGAGYTLRPIHQPAPGGLMGMSPALDRALDDVLDGDGGVGFLDLRHMATTA